MSNSAKEWKKSWEDCTSLTKNIRLPSVPSPFSFATIYPRHPCHCPRIALEYRLPCYTEPPVSASPTYRLGSKTHRLCFYLVFGHLMSFTDCWLSHSFFPFPLFTTHWMPCTQPRGQQQMVQNSTLLSYSLHLRMGDRHLCNQYLHNSVPATVLHHLILVTTSFTFAFLRWRK